MRNVGYFIVRGICDLCAKLRFGELGDDWQFYSAVIAAAFTRALIESLVLPESK